MAIVDASVAVKWVVNEPLSDLAIQLLQNNVLKAPELIEVEVRNALWARVRRNLDTAEEARQAEQEFSRIGIGVLPLGILVGRAFDLSFELDHPLYDCVYLAAAIEFSEPLITADQRFFELIDRSAYKGIALPLSAAKS